MTQFVIALTQPDDLHVTVGATMYSAPARSTAERFRIEDGAGSQEDLIAERVADLAQHFQGVGHGHGDFG